MFLALRRKEYLFSLFALLSAILGDKVESRLNHGLALAITDNLTHFTVACFTWASVVSATSHSSSHALFEILTCGALASLLDLDHFLAAKSFRLQDATSLKTRPPLHNTSLILLTSVLLLSVALISAASWLWTWAWLIFAAGISHHIRDASRRGFWFSPFGSTPALPTAAYFVIQGTFPLLLVSLRTFIPWTKSPTNLLEEV